MSDLIHSALNLPAGERARLLRQRASLARQSFERDRTPLNPGVGQPGIYRGLTERVALNGEITDRFKVMEEADEAYLRRVAEKEAALREPGRTVTTHNGLRVITELNWIAPTLQFAGMFYDLVVLQPNEQAIYQRTSREEIGVGYYGLDGKPYRHMFTDADLVSTQTPLPIKMLKSRRVEYPTMDLQRGDIRDSVLETFDLATDMAAKVDYEAREFARTGAYTATWTTATKKADKPFLAHSYVNTGNFPAGNIIAAGQDPSILAICDKIVEHCAKFGKGAFPDGDLMPTGRILVPSGDIRRIIGSANLTSTSARQTEVGEAMQKQGYIRFEYLGHIWELVPDNTLTKGNTNSTPVARLYVQLNKPVGTIFFKPAFDREVIRPVEDENGYVESRYLQKPVAFALPITWQRNALQVSYYFST